jgi:hypothetical protein
VIVLYQLCPLREIEDHLHPVVDVDPSFVGRIENYRGAEFALDLLVFCDLYDP